MTGLRPSWLDVHRAGPHVATGSGGACAPPSGKRCSVAHSLRCRRGRRRVPRRSPKRRPLAREDCFLLSTSCPSTGATALALLNRTCPFSRFDEFVSNSGGG